MSEFALHTYSSHVSIAYPKQLETIDVSDAAYHIYMINKINRLTFVHNSLKVYENHFEVQVQHGVTVISKIETIKIPRHENFVKYELEGDKTILMADGQGGGLKADIVWIYTNFSHAPLETEVLYIGQSYGVKGNRNALTRLKSHETLQKIMSDLSYEDINSEVVITVWEFTPRLINSIDGRSPYLSSEQEDKLHIKKVFSAPPVYVDSQIINVTEAALINYFKPKYNDKFKNNFPDISHKGYTFYYDYDYNAIIVELDTECININVHSHHKSYSSWSSIKYLLNSEEQRKSMFDL